MWSAGFVFLIVIIAAMGLLKPEREKKISENYEPTPVLLICTENQDILYK